MKKQQRRNTLPVILILAFFASSAAAFTSFQPRVGRRSSGGSPNVGNLETRPPRGNLHVPLHLSAGNNDNDMKENWKALTTATGKVVRNVGSSVLDAIKKGGSKFKEFVSNQLVPATELDSETAISPEPILVDTEDEDMFLRIFGGDDLAVPSSDSINDVVNEAALFLQQDDLTSLLLGSSLQHGRPFSQSSSTTAVNGKMSRTEEASFEVWGTLGNAVATVVAADGKLTDLDLQVDGQLYQLDVDKVSSSAVPSTTPRTPVTADRTDDDAWPVILDEDDDDEDVLEVEVIEGIRGRSSFNGRVLDAEIVDKTFL